MATTLKSINGDRARFLLIHDFGFLENTKNRKKNLGLQNRNKGGLGIIVKITISNITNHIGEVILKAKELRFSRILILSNSRRLEQICKWARKPSWQEQTLISDLNHHYSNREWSHTSSLYKRLWFHMY